MADTPTLKSLAAKLAEVMAEISRIPKRGHNAHFNYDYVTEADIVDAVREKLAARKVMLLPSIQHVTREGSLTTVAMTFLFIDGESGEREERTWAGTGDDKSDKGLYKALTGAEKYFLLKTFLVSTGDDPEETSTSATETTAPPKATAAVSITRVDVALPGTFTIKKVWPKIDKKPCGVVFSDDLKASTFSDTIQALARQLEQSKAPCVRTITKNGQYSNLTALSAVNEATGEVDEPWRRAARVASYEDWRQ